jgi:hypothetical protein
MRYLRSRTQRAWRGWGAPLRTSGPSGHAEHGATVDSNFRRGGGRMRATAGSRQQGGGMDTRCSGDNMQCRGDLELVLRLRPRRKRASSFFLARHGPRGQAVTAIPPDRSCLKAATPRSNHAAAAIYLSGRVDRDAGILVFTRPDLMWQPCVAHLRGETLEFAASETTYHSTHVIVPPTMYYVCLNTIIIYPAQAPQVEVQQVRQQSGGSSGRDVARQPWALQRTAWSWCGEVHFSPVLSAGGWGADMLKPGRGTSYRQKPCTSLHYRAELPSPPGSSM